MRLCFLLAMAVVLGCAAGAAACSDDTVPSSFDKAAPEAGADGADRPSDGATTPSDSPNLVGDAGPGSFYCGQTICYAGYYCVRVLSDAGVEESSACYPLLQCSDCPCVIQVVATSYCTADTIGCAGPPSGPLHVTCSAGAPTDAGGGGG
jgi:hypothetical protein